MRLVIVSLALNIGKLQSLVSEDNFFCRLYNDFCCCPFSFVSQIKNVDVSQNFLVSYDVTNLFTNIPLQKTIGIAINLTFNHNPDLNITRKVMFRLGLWLKQILFKMCWWHSSSFWQWTRFINFLILLNNRHPNIKFTIEKQKNHSIAFLDVFI